MYSILNLINDIDYYDFGEFSLDKPSIYFQSQMHGNETNSTLVLYRLLEYLRENINLTYLGAIRIVPRANPYSWIQSNFSGEGLYDKRTGLNWNRIFNWENILTSLDTSALKDKSDVVTSIKDRSKSCNSFDYLEMLKHKLLNLSIGYKYIVDVHTPEYGINHLYCNKFSPDLPRFSVPYVIEFQKPFSWSFDEGHCSIIERVSPLFNGHIPITLEIDSAYPATKELIDAWVDRIINQLESLHIIENNYISGSTKNNQTKIYIGTMEDISFNTPGIYCLNFNLNNIIPKDGKLLTLYTYEGARGTTETVKAEYDCIPLCFRKNGIINPGVWALRVLRIVHVKVI